MAKTTGKLGAFVSSNSGQIKGCITKVKINSQKNTSGFVYENAGTVESSVAAAPPTKGENMAGFCYRNRGNVNSSGYLLPETEGERLANEKALANAAKDGKALKPKYGHSDSALRQKRALNAAEVSAEYGLHKHFKGDLNADLLHSVEDNSLSMEGEFISVSTADELLEIIEQVNNGDTDAASASYRLENDIDLRGKSIDPMGLDEENPFTGTFDGGCHKINNFRINAKGRQYAGFFGYIKEGKIANLTVDGLIGGGAHTAGGLAGYNGGEITNCVVRVSVGPALFAAGGFVGKNVGVITACYACGSMAKAFPVWIILAGAGVAIVGIAAAAVILALYLTGATKPPPEDIYDPPTVIDPNGAPLPPSDDVVPPPSGSQRLSYQVNSTFVANAVTGIGKIDYRNPSRSTQDVVIRLAVSDAELVKNGYDLVADGIRTAEELAAADYNAEEALTVVYTSGYLKIGYGLAYAEMKCPVEGGSWKTGVYKVSLLIDAYTPGTYEKAVLNASVSLEVTMVDQSAETEQ